MSIDIRLAHEDEFTHVDDLVQEAYEHDYGPREPRQPAPDPEHDLHFSRVRARDFDLWVAVDRESGELVGSSTTRRPGGASLMEDSRDDELDLRLLAVSPRARRRGIGGALTRHAIETARTHDYAALFLKSAPNMLGAHQLYLSLGFQRDPERDLLIINGEPVHKLLAFRFPLSANETVFSSAVRASK